MNNAQQQTQQQFQQQQQQLFQPAPYMFHNPYQQQYQPQFQNFNNCGGHGGHGGRGGRGGRFQGGQGVRCGHGYNNGGCEKNIVGRMDCEITMEWNAAILHKCINMIPSWKTA